ncbi:class I SAM-dependent methyltransferase [Streptomyces chartreusis]|uniref:class I SAM-dependent methyltransferase n=1 Tax=Streptomyces chartreusis TaxID=1969 RepID=UPI00343E8D1B
MLEADHFQRIASPTPGKSAVDLACGTGHWTRQLAAWGMTVTGYDFCDEALRRAEAAGSCPRLSYRLWDIVADPIPPSLVPGQLDVVTCRHGLPYLEPGQLQTDVGRWYRSSRPPSPVPLSSTPPSVDPHRQRTLTSSSRMSTSAKSGQGGRSARCASSACSDERSCCTDTGWAPGSGAG